MSSEAQKQKKSEIRSDVVSLCGVVTVTFRVLSLFVVTKCYSYSKIESAIINCSSAWWISNKSTHQSKPASKITNTLENMFRIESSEYPMMI
jgi:hypothetical protein